MRGVRYLLLAAVLLVALCTSAPAAYLTIFSENFNFENGGKGKANYGKFVNWTVPRGWKVDLVSKPKKHKDQAPPDPATGSYVELGGGKDGGMLVLNDSLLLLPGSYQLEFDLAGSPEPRGGTSTAEIIVSGVIESGNAMAPLTAANGPVILYQETLTMAAGEPWTHFIGEFEVSAPSLVSFSWLGTGKAHQGLLLDNMALGAQAVPLPSTLALTGAGLLAMLLRRRRRWRRQS
jgi:hypothetical protein